MHIVHATSAKPSPSNRIMIPPAKERDRPPMRLVASAGTLTGSTRMTYLKHQAVFRAGDPATRLFEVIEGAVMVYQLLDDGRRQVVDLVLPGGICGFSSNGHYTSTGEALKWSLIRGHAKSDIARADALREKLADFAEQQICRLHQHALTLGRKTAEERVCSLLMRFAEANSELVGRDGLAPRDRLVLDIPMTRGEMGDYLGLSLETVCRTLSDMQQKAMIEIGRKQGEVRIRSLRRLRELASLEAA